MKHINKDVLRQVEGQARHEEIRIKNQKDREVHKIRLKAFGLSASFTVEFPQLWSIDM